MSSTDSVTSILQTYSIIAGALAAGANLSTSIITIPALLHAPSSTLAVQWKILFDGGIIPVVSMALTSAAGFATLAYRATSVPAVTPVGEVSHFRRNLYIGAAIAAFGLAPYTSILMTGNIKTLTQVAEAAAKGVDKAETHELVRRWSTLNFGRGLMLLVAPVLGLWAAVN